MTNENMGRSAALVEIDFHGARLLARRGATPADTLVAMKPVVEGMGLDWSAQLKRLKRHPVLAKGVVEMAIPSAGGAQDMTGIPLAKLNFWLATIQPNKVPDPTTRAAVIQYQEECADVLFAHFFAKAAGVDVDSELIRRIDGISRMLSRKVTIIEDVVCRLSESSGRQQDQLREIAREMIQEQLPIAVNAAVTGRSFASAVMAKSVRRILDDEKVPPKDRNRVNRSLGSALRTWSQARNVDPRPYRCDHTNVWLFPVEWLDRAMTDVGRRIIMAHMLDQGGWPQFDLGDDMKPRHRRRARKAETIIGVAAQHANALREIMDGRARAIAGEIKAQGLEGSMLDSALSFRERQIIADAKRDKIVETQAIEFARQIMEMVRAMLAADGAASAGKRP